MNTHPPIFEALLSKQEPTGAVAQLARFLRFQERRQVLPKARFTPRDDGARYGRAHVMTEHSVDL